MNEAEVAAFQLCEVILTRGGTRILDRVTAVVPAGRCTAVVGASGAGKSTLLRLLNRLDDPTRGTVRYRGTPLDQLDVLALRRAVQLVAQQPVLLADTVADELRVGRPDLPAHEVAALLELVGLPAGFAGRDTASLSGGEAQRVCLARALALAPQVLLLDEPTAALDPASAAAIERAIHDLTARGCTVVLVSHNHPQVRLLAHHVLLLDAGRLIAQGPAEQIPYLKAGR
ncbi:ABC transporter [Carbonactinospora thermoautotrophica]|uniref:ABC transporter n=1 Tax=Carbonactinospora thermoautotrophica TaxID=1469144 RepID=A0A132MXA0_9ACTN|nr:ATP-binding cassette domain-containing protein [Carbonactinospora thermoautotrophica]KWX02479.1 ABC transporter related [Carbonactinospora thermoautotrophica]KWX03591.1 ABC transporter [Carbonactinospora thermoautotrophica]KWX10763.1 ABC transporter [Carbonactinospora thermoautotrophica]